MKMTLIGMENYLNPDDSIINHMTFPEGIDKDTLFAQMILRCQEFELLYPNPDFFLTACRYWSKKNYWTFDKWVKALALQYDPIANYDRTEEITDTHSGSFNRSGNTSGSGTNSNTRTDDLTTTTDTTTTDTAAGFNSSTFENRNQEVIDNSNTQTGTVVDAGSNSFSNQDSSNGSDSYTDRHTARIKGNIGVTTTQQMLQSELELARFNLYDQIADLFCQEFCIMVY